MIQNLTFRLQKGGEVEILYKCAILYLLQEYIQEALFAPECRTVMWDKPETPLFSLRLQRPDKAGRLQ